MENKWNFYENIFLTTASRVKTAKEMNSIFKIKDSGGLLWPKLPAEMPHLLKICSPAYTLKVIMFALLKWREWYHIDNILATIPIWTWSGDQKSLYLTVKTNSCFRYGGKTANERHLVIFKDTHMNNHINRELSARPFH